MFLVNSRSALVTATSHSRGWHPFFRRYRANLPSSLARIIADTPWASHPGAPVSVLGTVAHVDPIAVFTGTKDHSKTEVLLALSSGSRHDGSPRSSALECTGKRIRTTSMRPTMGKNVCGAGILTGYPFGVLD